MLTLQDVKDFLKIEAPDEDSYLSSLLLSSEKFIQNATRYDADPKTDLFMLAQRFLIAHWYENPNAQGKVEKIPYHLDSLFLQITYAEAASVPAPIVIDTGEF